VLVDPLYPLPALEAGPSCAGLAFRPSSCTSTCTSTCTSSFPCCRSGGGGAAVVVVFLLFGGGSGSTVRGAVEGVEQHSVWLPVQEVALQGVTVGVRQHAVARPHVVHPGAAVGGGAVQAAHAAHAQALLVAQLALLEVVHLALPAAPPHLPLPAVARPGLAHELTAPAEQPRLELPAVGAVASAVVPVAEGAHAGNTNQVTELLFARATPAQR
jgi:hypothetical protein